MSSGWGALRVSVRCDPDGCRMRATGLPAQTRASALWAGRGHCCCLAAEATHRAPLRGPGLAPPPRWEPLREPCIETLASWMVQRGRAPGGDDDCCCTHVDKGRFRDADRAACVCVCLCMRPGCLFVCGARRWGPSWRRRCCLQACPSMPRTSTATGPCVAVDLCALCTRFCCGGANGRC